MAKLGNIIFIKNKANAELKKSRYEGLARNAALTRFVAAKDQLMEDFDADPVNQEIQAGPTSQGSSYLSWGNLYSFVGFDIESSPISHLKELIEDNVTMSNKASFSTKGNSFVYNFPVKYPSMQELYDNTKMSEFAGDYPNDKSFIELIRGAINNTIGSYIFNVLGFGRGSRSTTGLQNKNADNTFNTFTPSPDYIIGLFKKFKERFK